jgi:general secretion pathway protein G
MKGAVIILKQIQLVTCLNAISAKKETMSEPLFNPRFQPGAEQFKPANSDDRWRRTRFYGFTLLELLIVLAIIATLAAIAIPSYMSSRNKAKIAMAISEIKLIEKAILEFCSENGQLPNSLNDIGMTQVSDLWDRPYQYLRINGGTTPGLEGIRRRDKNANPVNSDFDLYSMGKDGESVAQFTGKKARDDIVRANNGRFYGLAEKH